MMGTRTDTLLSGPPEWVMVGVALADRYAIIASNTLTAADLDFRAREYQFGSWDDLRANFQPEITLTAHARGFVMTQGADYAQALAALLRVWQPQAAPRPTLRGPTPPAIGGPS